MNRRQALAVLTAMPAVASIAKVEALGPEDVIVVECQQIISDAARERIRVSLQDVWPGRRIVVLSDGLTLKVARA